ncbi:hypothetical protein [Myroides odoratimimus]|uniref:hypothetical protein n=1 Tax=Myroides odoratimimus TaxID=76832 RepID=UPI0031018EF6
MSKENENNALGTVAGVSSAGAAAGVAVATAAGVALVIPAAIGAGLAAIGFAVAKGISNSKK